MDAGASLCSSSQFVFYDDVLAIAENSKLEFVSFSAAAKGKLENVVGEGFVMTEITLRPKLILRNARDAERASRILGKAEKNCLISNSIKAKTNVEAQIDVVTAFEGT